MKVHRKKGDSLTELAVQMLQEVSDAFPERFFRVHADGFYASHIWNLFAQELGGPMFGLTGRWW